MARLDLLNVLVFAALFAGSVTKSNAEIPGTWRNPNPKRICHWTSNVAFRGSNGSAWTTREARMKRGWADVGEPENIFLLDGVSSPRVVSASVSAPVNISHGGEQAGIYLFANARSWVKLVYEANGKGVQLTFAEQVDTGSADPVPFVRGKLRTTLNHVSFRISVLENGTAVAEWAGDHGPFQPFVRGEGWLEKSELAPGQKGSLNLTDPRSRERAGCQVPTSWHAALIAEQWNTTLWRSIAGDTPCVQFSDIQTAGATLPGPSISV